MKLTASQAHIDIARSAAAEGMVLLKNNNDVLPLKKGAKVAVFGQACYAYIDGGFGSSHVYAPYARNLLDGLAIKEQEGKVEVFAPLARFYREEVPKEQARVEQEKTIKKSKATQLDQNDWMARFDFYQDMCRDIVMNELSVPDALMKEAAAFTDTAILVISRVSGEGFDRLNRKNDYQLSEEELRLYREITEHFEKCILVLNIGSVCDITAVAEDPKVSSILLAWIAGMEGGLAMADILCGDVNPSAKLTDTFAREFMDYPSSATLDNNSAEDDDHVYVEYFEDIYVGYRYFETIPGAGEKVLYPFGYGLSYTTFEMGDIDCAEEGGILTVTAKVTNTGAVAGKEVAQVYFSAPCGKLGKPAKQLCAFQKTDLLAPGESQCLTMTFAAKDMASFDDTGKVQKSAWVLEKGQYTIHVGNSVRNTVACDFAYSVAEDTVVQQLSSLCAPNRLAKRMLWDGTYEPLPQSDPKHHFYHHPPMQGTAPAQTVTYDRVGKDISLEDFIAQFTQRELSEFVAGSTNITVPVCHTACYPGNDRLGIPYIHTADGPAGLRIQPDKNVPATAFPCGTLLACTWDPEVIAQVCTAAAAEVKENGMYSWLAPGLNIHRTPLCGRNFEYYSEDPYISGVMASAAVKSIQALGVSCSIKHFACNNREQYRRLSDSRVSERALREVYLKGFEICVKNANPWTVMTSYNLVNGIHSSESGELLEGILRNEWGFAGFVTTDWGIKNNPVAEVKAGNDVKMPTGYPDELEAALAAGELTRGDLEACVYRILRTYQNYHF